MALCVALAHTHSLQCSIFLSIHDGPHRSICARDLIPPISISAALSPVAFRRKINSFHSIYQTEHLYVCLRSYICELVLVSGQSILLILSIRVQTCFSLGTNTLYIWVFTLCMLVSEMDGRSTTVDERVGG